MAVRDAVGDGILLVADANGGWGRHDALMAARLLSDIGNVVPAPLQTIEAR